MNWDDDVYQCPYCNKDNLVLAAGPRKAKILIIGDEPDKDEIKSGKSMSGSMAGVLRDELGRANLDMNQMRKTHLWLHPKNNNEKCFKHGLNQIIYEAKNRQAILLMGADTVKFFCDEKVSEVNGLVVKSSYFSAPLVFACAKPNIVFSGGLGDFRLSIQKFSKKVNKLYDDKTR